MLPSITWQSLVIGYLFGSIPTAWLLCRIFYGINIFEHGSRNMGATNVHRVLGTKPFAITLILDVLKGFAAVLFSTAYAATAESVVASALAGGAAAIIGHSLSIWVKFRGGKGVATGLGVFLAFAPKASVTAIGIFLLTLVSTGFVSLGSIAAACSLPFLILVFRDHGEDLANTFFVFSSIAAVFIVYKHKPNLVRLWNGQENALDNRKPVPEPHSAPPES